MRISRDYPTEGTRAGERGACATARTLARERDGRQGGGDGRETRGEEGGRGERNERGEGRGMTGDKGS